MLTAAREEECATTGALVKVVPDGLHLDDRGRASGTKSARARSVGPRPHPARHKARAPLREARPAQRARRARGCAHGAHPRRWPPLWREEMNCGRR